VIIVFYGFNDIMELAWKGFYARRAISGQRSVQPMAEVARTGKKVAQAKKK
jgi:hypothetical protein